MKQKLLIFKPLEFENKDEEIETPKHYVEGRKIQPIEVIEDVRLWRPYETV